MNFKHIDLTYLRTMSADDSSLQQQLLQMLLEDLDTTLPLLEKAIESSDWPSVKQLAHHLKTTFPYTGNDFVLAQIKKIEQEALGQSPAPQNIKQLFGSIVLHLPQVKQELTQALQALKNT
jgi:HPt (histidine-containing phosphotransfer) domain-containing protein